MVGEWQMNKVKAEKIPIDVLYEDEAIVVVDKPAGMMVHPAPGYPSGTLVNAVLAVCPEIRGVGSEERPGIVHRLDRDTSGVMVLAKTRQAYLALRKCFEEHVAVTKTYLAVVHGAPKPAKGRLETLIGRKAWDAKRMAVVEPGGDGKRAVTRWTVLQRHGGLAIVEFVIETGRTHQIRVHAAHLGHPIVGDPLYGNAKADRQHRAKRMLLHAVSLAFPHPVTGRRVEFSAYPPNDLIYI